MLAYNALKETKTTRTPGDQPGILHKQGITSVVTLLSLTLTTHRCGRVGAPGRTFTERDHSIQWSHRQDLPGDHSMWSVRITTDLRDPIAWRPSHGKSIIGREDVHSCPALLPGLGHCGGDHYEKQGLRPRRASHTGTCPARCQQLPARSHAMAGSSDVTTSPSTRTDGIDGLRRPVNNDRLSRRRYPRVQAMRTRRRWLAGLRLRK